MDDPSQDPETREVLYGQSARFVTGLRAAGEVVRSVCDAAERQLRSRPGSVLG